MSRSGFTDDCDSNICYLWDSVVKRATKGKRGQAMLHDLREALDALPKKRLVSGSFQRINGEVCTLGALGVARGVDMRAMSDEAEAGGYVAMEAAEAFGVARSLAAEIMYQNDDAYYGPPEDPEARWSRMRAWVESRIEVDR